MGPYGLHMPGPRGFPTVAARPPEVAGFSTTRIAEPPALPKETAVASAVVFFLDICCGASAPLSRELSSKGILCISVDILGNESLDLLCDSTYDDLLRLAFSGVIRYAHASPPCKEYSRLKLRPGGPSAVRTPEHLGGVPSNTPAQQSRVISSQKLLYRCVCILRAVFSAGGHASLEQPTNAVSWLEPFVQDLLSEFQARLVNVPACTVGQDIAKSWLSACSYTRLCLLAGTCTHQGGHKSVAGPGSTCSQLCGSSVLPLIFPLCKTPGIDILNNWYM